MWRCMVVFGIAAASTLGGCAMNEPDPGDYGHGTSKELGELLQRADAEQVLADRDRMLGEMASTLSVLIPGSRWEPHGDGDVSPCSEFGSTRGRMYYSPLFTSAVPVPAGLWDRAADAVVDIARRHGYTAVAARTQAPADGQLTNLDIKNAVGGYVTFGSDVQANFRATTGCYLTVKAKKDARDAATPT